MSFWGFVKDLLPVAAAAGATIYGANQASKANDKATQQMVQAQREGTQAQLEGLRVAREELAVNRNAASPGLLATQEIIARGSKLTPQQEQAVADTRGQALNALKGSSLRGSARTTSAIVADTDQRTRNDFMAQNQGRADSAALGLAGHYFGSGTNMANNATQTGNAISSGLTNTGTIQASNTIGQGALRGQTIGDVGAIIADAAKEAMAKERDSSYQRIG